MKTLIYIIFIVLYALVTFFGIGPVLMADGSMQERMLTLGIVILIYIALTFAFVKLVRMTDKKKKQ
jgi:arginine exporter protein ArgO